VDVISYYSKGGVPLSDDANVALGGHSIDVIDAQLAEVLKKYGYTPVRTDEKLKEMIELMQREHGGQAPSVPAPEKP
jgi:hypothetical protein